MHVLRVAQFYARIARESIAAFGVRGRLCRLAALLMQRGFNATQDSCSPSQRASRGR